MFKNVAAKFIVFAFDATTNVPKTGDAANITAYVSKDYGTVTVLADTTATEMDATNAPGYYLFDAAQGETNGDCLMVSGKSSTSNIKVIGAPAIIYTRPTTGWLAPTVAARTLDVSAGGEAGVDWANVGSPTTALALTGTTIAVTQKVDVDTIKTNPVVNGGTITFPSGATLASTTNITAGTITTATNLTNAPTAGDLTATMKASVTTAATAATPTAAAVTGNVGGNVVGSVGSVTGLTASNLDATVSSRLATSGYTAPPTAAQNATAVLTTQMTESYAADGVAPTLTQAAMLTQQMLTEASVALTTMTVKKLDGSTTAATLTLNSSTAPTSITRTT